MNKLTFSISFLILISFAVKGQNLQFSKAVYHKFESYNNCSQCISDTFTLEVGANKVFKLESASANGVYADSIGNDASNGTGVIALDGIVITAFSYSTAVYPRNLMPIWLPSGRYKFTLVRLVNNQAFKGYISGIEYNITQ